VTSLTRTHHLRTSWASPRCGEFARGVLVTLVLLAASPFHAPFSSFDQGHRGHVHAQAASAQKPGAQLSANALPPPDRFVTPFEHIASFSMAPLQNAGGLRTLRPILRV
jgi:hypothetical protein